MINPSSQIKLDIKKRVVIVGGGFAGMNAAKQLGNNPYLNITLIDRHNYHLFQPLLYQVAMAGLTPAEIAYPIRSQLAKFKNIEVVLGDVTQIDINKKIVTTDYSQYAFDFLILACGATHSYFGKNQWQDYAPGMKTVEQALEIRRRVLLAFECAEREKDLKKIKKLLTFVIVGGGPTGVELAGSLAEMALYTLAKDFRHIDSKKTRIILVEAGERILPTFSIKSSERAHRDLEKLGVTVQIKSMVIDILPDGVALKNEFIFSSTVIWAAGVKPSSTGSMLGAELDRIGRVKVEKTLNLKNSPNIFVLGDQAHIEEVEGGAALPGLAPVALQEGVHAAKNIIRTLQGKKMLPFCYFDKGQMATIGRGHAIVETYSFKLSGHFAWYIWLFLHIMYLNGFRNKILVLVRWMWSYFLFSRGARLITYRDWKI